MDNKFKKGMITEPFNDVKMAVSTGEPKRFTVKILVCIQFFKVGLMGECF